MGEIQKHGFTGGLNLDDDQRTVNPEDWRSANNIRLDSPGILSGNNNAVQNIPSNVEVTDIKLLGGATTTLPVGTNTIIGAHEDRKSDSVFYFLHNSNGDHAVLRYIFSEDVVYKLAEDSIFNFSLSNLITGIAFIENFLYWGDDLNPYRKLNVVEVENYTFPLIEDHISLVKRPPLYPMTASRIVDSEEDNLGGKPYWFRYRYVYKDGEKSVFSPESKAYSTEFTPGTQGSLYPTTIYNKMNLRVPSGEPTTNDAKFDEVIDKVEFAFKNEYLGSYRVFTELPFSTVRTSGGGSIIEFRNKDDNYVVPDSEINKAVDAVPLSGKALSAVDNRIVLGNYTEGYDSSDLEVLSTAVSIESTWDFPNAKEAILSPNGKYKLGVIFFDEFGRSNGVSTSEDLIFDASFINNRPTTFVHDITYLDFTLQNTSANIPEWATHYRLCITENLKMIIYTWVNQAPKIEGVDIVYFKARYIDLNGVISEVDNVLTLLTINDLRPIEVLINTTSLTDFGDGYNFSNGDRVLWYPPGYEGGFFDLIVLGVEEISGQNYVRAKIEPSEFSTADQILPDPSFSGDPLWIFDGGGAPNGNDWYTSIPSLWEQVDVPNSALAKHPWLYVNDNEVGFTMGGGTDRTSYVMNYPKALSSNKTYTFSVRVEVIPSAPSTLQSMNLSVWVDSGRANQYQPVVAGLSTSLATVFGETGFDLDLRSNPGFDVIGTFTTNGTGGSYIGVKFNYNQGGLTAPTLDVNLLDFRIYEDLSVIGGFESLAQIYTPKSNSNDELFYEFGQTYEVITPGDPSRTLEKNVFTSSDYRFSVGDAYYPAYYHVSNGFHRYFVQGSSILSNHQAPNFGRVNANIDLKQSRVESGLRFSNAIIDESNINGLSSFDAFNNKVLPSELGQIQKLQVAGDVQQEGSVLLTVHEEDVVSIYIGKTEYNDQSGQSQVVTSDQFLGTFRVLKGNFGTLNPESVVQYESNVYAFDATKGKVWKYTNNGLFAISDIKVSSWSNLIGRMTQSANGNGGTARILGSFDILNDEYVISVDIDGSTYELTSIQSTLTFSTKRQRWISFHGFFPEYMSRVNNLLLSFKDGRIYKHNEGTTYGEYYGVTVSSSITTVSNKVPSMIKLWEDLSTESNSVWRADSIINDKGQFSSTIDSDFLDREGVYYAYMLRDENTPNITLPKTPILHGDEMRSSYVEIEWINEDSTQALLRFVNIGFFVSSGHDNLG